MMIGRFAQARYASILALLFVVQASASAQSIVLENTAGSYEFQIIGDDLYLDSVLEKVTQTTTSFAEQSLWEVVTRDMTSGNKTTFNQTHPWDLTYNILGGNELVATWSRAEPTLPVDSVTLRCLVPAGSATPWWTLDADAQGSTESLFQLRLQFALVEVGAGPANDMLAVPFNKVSGQKVDNPQTRGVDLTMSYPGNQGTMQFLTVYDQVDESGIYFGTHDIDQYLKEVRFRSHTVQVGEQSTQTVEVSVTHLVEDALTRQVYFMPYGLEMGAMQGDWYDACLIYRDWVMNAGAPWLGLPVKDDPNVPQWIKDTPFALALNSGSSTEFCNSNLPTGPPTCAGDEDWTVQLVQDYFSFLNVPHKPMFWFGWMTNDDFEGDVTPKGGFGIFMTNLHLENARTILWMNAREWGNDYEFDSDYFNQLLTVSDTDPWAFKCEEGEVRKFGVPACEQGSKSVLFPGSFPFQLVTAEKTLLRLWNPYQISGRHYDLYTANEPDYDPLRSHTQGGGSYADDAARSLPSYVSSILRSFDPDFVQTVEGTTEILMNAVDIMAFRPCLSAALPDAPLLPMFEVVYSAHQRRFGSNQSIWGSFFTGLNPTSKQKRRPLTDSLTQAQAFLWGHTMVRYELTHQDPVTSSYLAPNVAMSPTLANVNNYLKNLVERWDGFKDYLRDGELLRPVRRTSFRTVGDDPILNQKLFGDWSFACPAFSDETPYVLDAVWRSTSGTVAVFFANWNDLAEDIEWEIDAEDYGLNPNISHGVFTHEGVLVDSFTGTLKREGMDKDSLDPFSLLSYKICPLGSSCP